MSNLKIDKEREVDFIETGIYVRAISSEGKWCSADISQLEKESLLTWMRERNSNEAKYSTAEQIVLILLGHDHTE